MVAFATIATTNFEPCRYSRIGAYRTCTYGKEFPCEQNSGDVSPIVITIEQAYVVTTIQA